MPVKSRSSSPQQGDGPQTLNYLDPRIRKRMGSVDNQESAAIAKGCAAVPDMDRSAEGGIGNQQNEPEKSNGTTEWDDSCSMDSKQVDIKSNSTLGLKKEDKNELASWTMEQIEDFFVNHGYREEVDYVKQTELKEDKLKRQDDESLAPMTNFSLKMGLRVLELIKVLRKLSETSASASSNSNQNSSSWGRDNSSTSYNSNSNDGAGGWGSGGGGGRSSFGGNSSFDFGSGGRGRGGGGGGGRACFKCNETGHIARECPTGGGGGRGGGGGSRNCFKCNEPGHMARECPNASSGGGMGRGDGGGSRYNNRDSGGDSGFSSSWGGKHRNDDGNDGGPSAKRPRQGGNDWNSSGGNYQSFAPPPPAPVEEESWD